MFDAVKDSMTRRFWARILLVINKFEFFVIADYSYSYKLLPFCRYSTTHQKTRKIRKPKSSFAKFGEAGILIADPVQKLMLLISIN